MRIERIVIGGPVLGFCLVLSETHPHIAVVIAFVSAAVLYFFIR